MELRHEQELKKYEPNLKMFAGNNAQFSNQELKISIKGNDKMINLPKEFFEWNIDKQYTYLLEQYQQHNTIADILRKLLGIVNGGNKVTKDYFKVNE